MSDLKYSFLALASMIVLASCSDKNSRNYQYMPNMYESVGYETYQEVDFLSNGFKWKGTDTRVNANNYSYIYMAFGQSIVGSNNIPATAR